MMISAGVTWESFHAAVVSRLSDPLPAISMEFEDPRDDDVKVSVEKPSGDQHNDMMPQTSLNDRDDYRYAIATVCAASKGESEGRLRIWCSEEGR